MYSGCHSASVTREPTGTFAVIAGLGWSAVRVRDLTRGGFKERVRGYVPDARAALERGTGQSTADGLTTPLASKGFRNGV